MWRPPTRFWALAILVFLIAAQFHVWVENGAAPARGHSCRACISLGWAIVSAPPGLDVVLWALRMEAESPGTIARHQRSETSVPRAPPHA
jgi:hypothetical protein